MPPPFDAAWQRRALRGDAAAVRRLTDHGLPALYRFCYHRVGRDTHLCEEVVQETLLRALDHLGRYDPGRAGGEILPWLQGLARNEIQRLVTRRPGGASLDALWARADAELAAAFSKIESEPLPDAALERDETRALVNATMAQLPAHYREVLEGKYVHGLSQRALAEAGRVSEKAVESLLSRARQAFRAAFTTLANRFELEAI